MTNTLIPVASIQAFNDLEPRIRDLDLADFLQLLDPHDVRRLIERNRDELEMHGNLVSGPKPETTLRGGRPAKAYWLNEGQALVICALSRTARAALVRKALIDVFVSYRSGKLVDVRAHHRRLPQALPREYRSADFKRIANKLDMMLDGYSLPPALTEILAHQALELERLREQMN